MSGVGKGIAASSIGRILASRGLNVSAVKIDPYVNVDAGTMNPTEHGEVFVLDDGTECDMDMGNYERFLGRSLGGGNYMTTGSVYLSVINKERALEYGGKCVEVVPDIPFEVLARIKRAAEQDHADVMITEIGGTLGEYQNVLFLEAIRMLRQELPERVIVVLVSLLPSASADNSEPKTKPTQHAVRDMHYTGLHPDIIVARASVLIDEKRKQKLSFNCGVDVRDVISAPDTGSIYDVPVNFEHDGLTERLLAKLHLTPTLQDLSEWRTFAAKPHTLTQRVSIGIVGKYFKSGGFMLADSYVSVIEALRCAAYHAGSVPDIRWINADDFETDEAALLTLDAYDGVIVPGGFGSRGIEGKIAAIRYAREHRIPYFGLCYGMQLMLVEFARDICGLAGANTVEVDAKTKYPVVDLMPDQQAAMHAGRYGATMRLGAYPANLKRGTRAARAYGTGTVSERHRHRYEVNPAYIGTFEEHGLVFSGVSPDGRLMEIAELPEQEHPFFLGTQFHPEFTSRPLVPHPLFAEFIKTSIERHEKR